MEQITKISHRYKRLLYLLLGISLIASLTKCKKDASVIPENNIASSNASDAVDPSGFSSEVVDKWITMQLRLDRDAVGIANVAFCRYYAYSGVAAFEAVSPGIAANSFNLSKLNGLNIRQPNVSLKFYWPASVNAALAYMNRKMYTTASATDKAAIDSLETALNNIYLTKENPILIARSDSFGVFVATMVFNWSETDGYLHASDPYTPPTGPGLWIPTPPAFAPASEPYWGNIRPIIAGSTDNTQPGPPIPYSKNPNSAFYKMVKHVYTVSKHLTSADSAQALFWRDIPGVTSPGHWLSILQQVLKQTNSKLDKAAFAYALSGACLNDAEISCWQTKYHYNLIRPISYIRNVIGDTGWLSLLTTPAHPEYSSAHGVASGATTKALQAIFGDIGSFTDHTYDYLGFAPRTFSSFQAIGEDAAHSRVYAGIHYRPSCDTGLVQGRKVTGNILRIIGLRSN